MQTKRSTKLTRDVLAAWDHATACFWAARARNVGPADVDPRSYAADVAWWGLAASLPDALLTQDAFNRLTIPAGTAWGD